MHKQSGSRCEMLVAYSGPCQKIYGEASPEIVHG